MIAEAKASQRLREHGDAADDGLVEAGGALVDDVRVAPGVGGALDRLSGGFRGHETSLASPSRLLGFMTCEIGFAPLIPLKDDVPTTRFPILTALLIVANMLSSPGSSAFPRRPRREPRAEPSSASPKGTRTRSSTERFPTGSLAPARSGPSGLFATATARAPRSSARERLSTRKPNSSATRGCRFSPSTRLPGGRPC